MVTLTLSKPGSERIVRLMLTVVGILGFVIIIWITGRVSFARILSRYASGLGSLPAANEALRLAPSDSEGHFARAIALRRSSQPTEALLEFESAVALRPRDYFVWLQLGMARDENADQQGALEAFNEAVRLAPYYAQPRWQRGNLLLRMQQYDSAFVDLRQAAQSDPEFIPNLVDLSWGMSRGDVKLAEQLGDLSTPKLRLALAHYLTQQGKAAQALEVYRSTGPVSDEIRREIVAQLLARKAYPEALQIWRGLESTDTREEIYDGGFEAPLSLDESGFGWRVPRNLKGAVLSLDGSQRQTGERSLQVEFTGESPTDVKLVSQLLVVKPGNSYQVSFATRSKEIVSGGLPVVTVHDAIGNGKALAESRPLAQGTSEWQTMSFNFKTQPDTTAVVLSLQRQSCAVAPCPAFGSVWLDSFGLSAANKVR